MGKGGRADIEHTSLWADRQGDRSQGKRKSDCEHKARRGELNNSWRPHNATTKTSTAADVEVGQREFPLDYEPGFLDSLGCKTAALNPRATWRVTKHELEVHGHEGGMSIYISKPETKDKPNRHQG